MSFQGLTNLCKIFHRIMLVVNMYSSQNCSGSKNSPLKTKSTYSFLLNMHSIYAFVCFRTCLPLVTRPGSSLLCVEKTASPSYGAICAVKEERKTSKTPAWVSFVSSNTSPETLPLQHPGVVLRRGLTDLLKGPSREQEGGIHPSE